MKKSIKEKTNKIYLAILCGLLVSGAIVCSTNGNGDGNGGGENSESPFVCTNGQEVTDSNTTEGENIQNCASCDAGFEEAMQDDGRMICQPGFTCPNGAAVTPTADNMPTAAGEENCAECTTNGFTLEAADEMDRGISDRMVCRTPYVCPNGIVRSGTTSMANVENCSSCDSINGFTRSAVVVQGEARTVCRASYICPNGTIQSGTTSEANVENCASCNTDDGFMRVAAMSGSEMVCRMPYVCPNGTEAEGTSATAAGEVNCASCNTSFTQTAVPGSGRMTCEPNSGTNAFVCTNGRIADGTPATANVENCASCDAGFESETQDDNRSTCVLSIALWNAGKHDGDFGFDFCQNRIAESSADTIGSELRGRGYTKAVFFGSTGTGGDGDYLFINIGSDIDALALPAVGAGSPGSVSDRNIVVFAESSGAVSVTNTFGSPAMARTLGNVTDVAAGGGFQNGGADVVSAVGVSAETGNSAWSFSLNRGFDSTNNCNNAMSNSSSMFGTRMSPLVVDGDFGPISTLSFCNGSRFVLCVAR